MSYLAQWVSEVKEGHTITAADVEVLARVQQCILAADKHHKQARDAQANVAEKLVVSRAVEVALAIEYQRVFGEDTGRFKETQDNLIAAVDRGHKGR